jgi:CRP/FNR family transcriptional regulator
MLVKNSWRAAFPRLAGISEVVSDLLDEQAQLKEWEKGALIFGPDNPPDDLWLLVSGTVRVQLRSDDGSEIVLYRLHSDEIGVMTTACMLAFENYAAEGVAETDVIAIKVPRKAFDQLMTTSNEFCAFVFEGYSKRITDLFSLIENVNRDRMDIHIAQRLLDLRHAKPGLRIGPERLAAELGTAREEISRYLNEFERRGWLSVDQGEIKLRDVAAIERLARPPWLVTPIALSPPGQNTIH